MRDNTVPEREPTAVSGQASTIAAPPSALRRISWGAIIGGVVAAVSILLLLNLLGLGIGASTIDPMQGDRPGRGMAIGAGIWFVVSFLIALAVGGWASGRMLGVPNRKDGMLHGFLTWGLTSLVLIWTLTTAVGGLLGGATSVLGRTAQSAAPTVSGIVQEATGVTPREIQEQDGDLVSDPSFRSFVSGVLRDGQANPQDRANLAQVISQKRGVPVAQAEAQITQWQQQLTQTREQVGQKAAEAGEKAASGVSRAALVSFAALLLGAIAATVGGGMGSPGGTYAAGQREIRRVA